MTPDERLDFQMRILDALADERAMMGEGRPHHWAKRQTFDALHLHFRTQGRDIYLAEESPVLYPGEPRFVPDILAVTDVPQPADDTRLCWVVADEGKGLDLIIEVLHRGKREKDLEDNVSRYARLGIGEYFIYELGQDIRGYRLEPNASHYTPIMAQHGRYRSNVLGLDLKIIDGKLRLFAGQSELPGSEELIERFEDMMANQETKAREAEARAEARGVREAILALRETLLAFLQARAIPVPDEARARVQSCAETATLRRWLLQSATASGIDDVFAVAPPTERSDG